MGRRQTRERFAGADRRETTGKVLKDRRPHRRRGRMGTSVYGSTDRSIDRGGGRSRPGSRSATDARDRAGRTVRGVALTDARVLRETTPARACVG
eukprot:31365-Pelagococcus_subviridis.AAC.21